MKYEKNSLDIKFIKTCKQGSFLPTFAMVQLQIKNSNYISKQRIGRKEETKETFKTLSIQLKSCVNVLINSVLPHKSNIAVKSRPHACSKRHDKKLFNVRKQKDQPRLNEQTKQFKTVIHNFS